MEWPHHYDVPTTTTTTALPASALPHNLNSPSENSLAHPPPPPSLDEEELPRKPHRYLVLVQTGEPLQWNSGTDLPVHLTLVGDQGTSEQLVLNDLPSVVRYAPPHISPSSPSPPASSTTTTSPSSSSVLDPPPPPPQLGNNPHIRHPKPHLFSSGSVREFEANIPSVGDLVKLRISLKLPKDAFDAAWKLDRVLVTDDTLHRGWMFVANRWLNKSFPAIELLHSGDVSAGRRATHLSARRLSDPNHVVPADASSSSRFNTSMTFFKSHAISRRLAADDPAAPPSPLLPTLSSASTIDGGVRRVCFQVQTFDRPNCHLYLSGDTEMMGKWDLTKALRLRMVTGGDDTFDGEWRLELEMDDASAVIHYSYVVVDESVDRAWWETTPEREPRQLTLAGSMGKHEATDRTIEGGVLYVKDILHAISDADYENGGTSRKLLTRGPTGKRRSSITSSHESIIEDKTEEDIPNVDFSYVCGEDLEIQAASLPLKRSSFTAGSPFGKTEREIELERKLDAVRDVLTKREGIILSQSQMLRDLERKLGEKSTQDVLISRSEDGQASGRASQRASGAGTSPVSSELNLNGDESADSERDIELLRADGEEALARVRNLGGHLKAAKATIAKQIASNVGTGCKNLRMELDALRSIVSEKCEQQASAHAKLCRLVIEAQVSNRAEVQALLKDRESIQTRWAAEFAERRRLFNLVQELRGNIRVYCRVRPLKAPSKQDVGSADPSAVSFPDSELGLSDACSIEVLQRRFEFDHVFQPNASQTNVYRETSGVVLSVLDGYNVCVFAYGQTGSGKTYTMNGPAEDRGVNYRALTDLFDNIKSRSCHSEFEVSVSMVELYNESLRDLLFEPDTSGSRNMPPPKLEIRKDPSFSSPNAVYIPNLTSTNVSSVVEVWKLMETGAKQRAQHATDMNEHSSRSHLILQAKVSAVNKASGVRSTATLSLVDLAGSERLNRSKAVGERLKEAQFINKSLSTLGDVFMALAENSPHVPYRNSKLTYLLQESLGGDSKTLMFVNVSCDDADVGETLSSLQFAQRVAKIERGQASKHLDISGAKSGTANVALEEKDSQIASLQGKLASAERELRKKDESSEELRRRLMSSDAELKQTVKFLDEHKRRDEQEKRTATLAAAGHLRELAELRQNEEKRREELRILKMKLRDITISREEEIKRLQTALDERSAMVRRLQLESKSSIANRTVPGTVAESSGRVVSRPRLPARTGLGSRTFTTGQRSVRFESVKSPPLAAPSKSTARQSMPSFEKDGSNVTRQSPYLSGPRRCPDAQNHSVLLAEASLISSEKAVPEFVSAIDENSDAHAVIQNILDTEQSCTSEGVDNETRCWQESQDLCSDVTEDTQVADPAGSVSSSIDIDLIRATDGTRSILPSDQVTPGIGAANAAKRKVHSVGPRVDAVNLVDSSPPSRVPRTMSALRPAQRLATNTTIPRGQTSTKLAGKGPGRVHSGPRRAGTFTAGSRPPSAQI